MSLFDGIDFTPPSNFFDSYKGRNPASNHEMGIFKHMDVVYDLKMLDKQQQLKTTYRTAYQKIYDRMDNRQKEVWDAHYDPILKDFMKSELTGEDLALWKFNRYMKDYLSTVQSVDDGVGTLLDYLDENDLTQNTIVVYTSDQGFYLGEHGWFDKRFMYEESFRTPLLMRYPEEIKAGTVIDDLVQNIDFAPTFLDYAGVTVPSDIQGVSLRKLVKGEVGEWRDAIYYTYYEFPGEHNVPRHHGVRTDQYKLIHFYFDSNQWELYDLEKDPSEMHNVYEDKNYKNIREMMHEKLNEMRKKYGDSDSLDQRFLENYMNREL